MFHLEGIMLIAVLCAVNASVTINIYDDDLKSNTLRNVNSCDYRKCDQLCRRIGFPGGACVGDRCKCDIILNNELEDRNKDQSVLGCVDNVCDQMCRRMGFTGGECVDNRCNCDNFSDSKELEDKKVDDKLHGCNYRACDQLCRRLGFPGGVCVGDRCKCDNFLQSEELEDKKIDGILHRCNYQACDQLCRRLGFPGGVCVGDRCKCDNFLQPNDSPEVDNHENREVAGKTSENTEAYAPIDSLFDETNSIDTDSNDINNNYDNNEVVETCNGGVCEFACRDLGYPGGACIRGKCKCNQKGEDNKLSRSLQYCDIVACNNMCHRLHYIGGMCQFGSCQCY